MAKSFDKKDVSTFINDDMIKEALKTGLTSIQASDDLVKKTLTKCQNELTQEKLYHKATKLNFMPWVYKLGTPLAAGALILVLVLNGNQLISKDKYATSAPQAAGEMESGLKNGAVMDRDNSKNEESVRSSAMPKIEFSESFAPSVAPVPDGMDGIFVKGLAGGMMDYAYGSIEALNSSVNRTQNMLANEQVQSLDTFKPIVDQYNAANGTQFTLNEADVTRIQTLVSTGVNADMLLVAKSYRDLLSDEGYWALPLKNTAGVIEGLLSVNIHDEGNPNKVISSNDILFTFKQEEFLISTHPASALISKTSEMMFDSSSLVNLVQLKGYKTVSKTIVVDINYGMDFISFVEADGQELAIPFLINETQYGLENKKVYDREELFKIISEHLQK